MARTKAAGKVKQHNRKETVEAPPSDLEDEVDAFHKGKDKVHLDPALDEDSDQSFDEDEAGIYDLDIEESQDESDDEDGGHLADLAQQERLLRSKLQLQQGAESVSEEEEEEKKGWGSKKRAYYEDQELDEEEALKEEEEEALVLQREATEALQHEDFGAASSSEEDGEDEGNNSTLGRAAQEVEAMQIDREGAPDTSLASVQADAPELEALLSNFESSLEELRTRVGPLVKEVREGQLATAEGVSYLETKNMLLLHYCLHLVFYLLLKAEGRPVQQHPVIARLVEIRAFLERIRPIDKKLRYQMEKLLTSHQLVQVRAGDWDDAEIDPLQYRPNPDALVPKIPAAESGAHPAKDGVYRPPKLNPVAMEDDPDKDYHRREKRAAADKARKSARSQLVKDLAREIADAPDELQDVRVGEDTGMAAQQRARLERHAAEEEELMMRVPLSKQERRGLKAARRAGMSGGALLDDFADDVADLVQASADVETGGRLSQKFGADFSQIGDLGKRSGDADLPTKMSLSDRRARIDNVRAKQVGAAFEEDDQPFVPAGKKRKADLDDQDNEVYEEARTKLESKKAAKAAKYAAPALQPPLDDGTVLGPRKVTKAVEKNRGLTPHRRKDTKNPRVKGRKKFAKATVRRRGQVADVKKPMGVYGGEQTGIKARVSKSTRF